MSISGISGGTSKIDYQKGISGNHDLQYRLGSVTTLAQDTWITLFITGAKNPPGPNGSIGWDYISVYDSTAASHDAFWTYNNENGTSLSMPSNHYVNLKEKISEPKDNLTPTIPTPTSRPQTPINDARPTVSQSTDVKSSPSSLKQMTSA